MSRTNFLLATICLALGFTLQAQTSSSAPAPKPKDWPEPVEDTMRFGLLLLDLFEYEASRNDGALRWDTTGWWGGDYNRVWVRSEGRRSTSSARTPAEGDLQLLYGRLISPFFDMQVGVRQREFGGRRDAASRIDLVLGLTGLAPYEFQLEPTIFIGRAGEFAAQLTAAQDILFTQRTVLQMRLETSAASRKDEDAAAGSGLNDLEVGLRLRHEILREFAPYVGVSWRGLFGETAQIARRDGARVAAGSVFGGIRAWY